MSPLTNLDFSNGAPVAFVGGQNGYPAGLAYMDTNNITLRIGLVWAPNDAKNVLRGGAGVFYSYPAVNFWCNQVHNVPLVFPEIQTNNAATPTINSFGFAPPVLGRTLVRVHGHRHAPADPAHRTGEPELRAPVDVDRDGAGRLPGRVGVELRSFASGQQRAAGVWRRAAATAVPDDLIRTEHGSRHTPAGVTVQSLTFPVGPINLLESTGTSQYNSFWVLTKRTFSRGLSDMASYTYADSLTDAPTFRSPVNEAEVP
jgi:hypothetical protein